jgi:hypothetical protein
MSGNPFDTGRDEPLGRLLRQHLEADDEAGFVARVRRALPAPRTSWDVLAEWSRPGIAAALLAATALGWALAGLKSEDVAEPGAVISEMPTDTNLPDQATLAALVLETP